METPIQKKIKEIRERYNLSQERFGKKIGISGKSVSAYETGKCIPSPKVLERISEIYDSAIFHLCESKRNEIKTKFEAIKQSLRDIERLFSNE